MAQAPKKEELSEKVSDLGKQAQATVKKAWVYAGTLDQDTIAYIVLAVGVFLFFISPIFGGAIVGAVLGVVFVDQVTTAIRTARGYVHTERLVQTVSLIVLLVILIYALPTLFLGAIAAVGVVSLIRADSKKRKAK